jgi:hypothetical protein
LKINKAGIVIAASLTLLWIITDSPARASDRASRIIPVRVEYKFSRNSEIQDPTLVKVNGIRLFHEAGRSMYYLQVLNKTHDPLDIDGDIYFYDQGGKEIYKHMSTGIGVGEIAGQLSPGLSEGVDMSPDFFSFDLDKISRAYVIVKAAWSDNADRD